MLGMKGIKCFAVPQRGLMGIRMIKRDDHERTRSTYPTRRPHLRLEVGVNGQYQLHAIVNGMIHNHPSGDATPSRGDIDMTRKIVEAAKAMEITIHDHIIISQAGYNSFKTLGLI
jgi:proteasome lid subunit RPN8/RPN11